MAQSPTLAVRAALTDAEYMELRRIALATNTRVSQLVAAALRVAYPLTPKETNPE